MMTRRLVEVRKNYFISSEYELRAPLPGERPYDAFLNGFNLSTNALDAGLRFSLHPVIEVFPTEWTSWMVNNIVLALSVDETELVKILRGILSASKGVKDMNEAWLAEVGLDPTPSSPTTGVSTSAMAAESLAKKWPSVDEGLSLRKHSQRETPKHQAKASGSTTRVLSGKGKEPIAMEEAPKRGYTH
ncbi:hypothetical protein BHE74_00039859 [Ensete ventricosum]|nr:hypothetical protein BHE74_00039859 [Ensete ventricosum]